MRRFPFYVFLLPLFFVLHGYVQQYGLLPGGEALRLLLIYLLVAALLLFAGRRLTGNWRKGGVLVFAALSVELFYGAGYDALHVRAPWLPLHWALVLPVALLLLGLVVAKLKKTNDVHGLTGFGNLLLLVLLLVEGTGWMRRHQALVREQEGRLWKTAPTTAIKPDVFLVIADEYAGNRTLRDGLGFDNRAFLNSLRALGFRVDSNANANYNFTEYSTASLLNGAYFPAASRTNATDVGRCFHWITGNETTRYFRAQGYVLHNHSIFDLDGAPSSAPRTWNAQWNDILRQQTLSARALRTLLPEPPERANFRTVNDSVYWQTLRTLEEPATSPRFVYTHLLLPHSPYFYNAEGKEQPPAIANDIANTAAYVEYLRYGNGIYLSLVQRILSQARRPTVILLLGDHGFRSFRRDVPKEYYFQNLHAVYTSPGLKSWPSAGLVNEFRLLLDSCFGQHLPLLPNEQHFIGDQEH
ncbi:MAG: hypothetical protein EOP50_03825 [Sphingobacteriales bacterium]|nr:MAG: hypothetical protein EOP50_03825 [Sphingobacteriales bacterium]